MFGDNYEHLVAGLSVGRVTAIVLMALGLTLLVRGAYQKSRTEQVIGGILTLFPSTFHYSLTTLFALTLSAEALELIAYLPLANFERWQETQDVLIKSIKLLGFLAIGFGIWGFWHLHYSKEQRLRFTECALLAVVGFVFIYFIEISHIVSRVVTHAKSWA